MSVLSTKTKEEVKNFFDKTDYYKNIRNMAIIAHVDHGKSTLVDNLLAQSNFLDASAVGSTITDVDTQEKARGITINNSAISIFNNGYLFNLIDTPGHVDFGSEVAKSLRTIDGALLVMDSIEGVMVQTESVIAQAIKENVSLILMVNKIDRLITELKLDAQDVYKQLQKNISQVNALIKKLTNTQKDYFEINQNVIFGSALKKWAFTIPELQKNGDRFSYFIEKIKNKQDLGVTYNLAKIVLDLCAKRIKNPLETHEENTRHYFKDQPEVLALKNFLQNPLDEPFRAVITDINYDKILGLVHTIRVISGTYDRTKNLYCSEDFYNNPIKKPTRYSLVMINKYLEVEKMVPGAIFTLQGCEIKHTGTTLSQKQKDTVIYPQISYMREPIFSLSVTPEKLSELPKMVEGLKILCLEDPTLQFEYDENLKEFTLSGVGVLHLEVTLKKLQLNHQVKVITGSPKIPYVETLEDELEKSDTVSVRTPNKHNDFNFYIFNLPNTITKRLLNNEISAKSLNQELEKELPRELAKSAVKIVEKGNVYFDMTHGADFMEACKTLLTKSLSFTLNRGVKLPTMLKGLGIVITYAKIHEDSLHRTEIQLRSAFRDGIEEIFTKRNPSIVKEPIMKLTVKTPMSHLEAVSTVITNKRGYLVNSEPEEYSNYLNAIYMIPLSETLDLSADIMSVTEGRAIFFMDFEHFEQVPASILKKILDLKPVTK